jgi:hypothetical protein
LTKKIFVSPIFWVQIRSCSHSAILTGMRKNRCEKSGTASNLGHNVHRLFIVYLLLFFFSLPAMCLVFCLLRLFVLRIMLLFGFSWLNMMLPFSVSCLCGPECYFAPTMDSCLHLYYMWFFSLVEWMNLNNYSCI